MQEYVLEDAYLPNDFECEVGVMSYDVLVQLPRHLEIKPHMAFTVIFITFLSVVHNISTKATEWNLAHSTSRGI